MTIYISHQVDGIDFLCSPVTFDSLTGATTLTGATVAVDAINSATRAKITGTANVVSANSIRCTFAPWSLAVGQYSVQVRAKPAGYAEQTIADEVWWVKELAAVQP